MDNIQPTRGQKAMASRAYEETTKPKESLSFHEKVLRSICNFLGISTFEDKNLEADFAGVAQDIENLFHNVDYKDPVTFNTGVDTLRKDVLCIAEKHADKLPEGFDANAFINFVFKEAAKELSPEQVIAIYDSTDADWDEYDPTAMSAILKGIRDSIMEGAQPRINLGEEALINLNTRVECFGSHFQTAESKSKDKAIIGSGVTHSVYSLPYAVGHFEGEETSQRIKAFKPIEEHEIFTEDTDHFPEMLGLEATKSAPVRTRFLERNLVVSALDNKLGFGVIARTQPAIHEGQRGIVMELYAPDKEGAGTDAPELGSAKPMKDMEKAGLKALHADPQYRRDSISLQLVDFITGQTDRHQGNYLPLLGKNNQYLGLKGIDSDACAGAKVKPAFSDWKGRPDFHNQVALPQVVDRGQYDAIMSLTGDDIEDLSQNRLTRAEIKANKERLTLLQDHLQKLDNQGQIIDHAEDCSNWKGEAVEARLRQADPEMATHSSYYGREYTEVAAAVLMSED